MDARDLIKAMRRAERILQLKKEELVRLESAVRYQAISYDKVPSVPRPDSKEKAYLNLIELRDEVERMEAELDSMRAEIIRRIQQLPSELKIDIMDMYCLKGMTLSQIAQKTFYSKSHIYLRWREALDLMDNNK